MINYSDHLPDVRKVIGSNKNRTLSVRSACTACVAIDFTLWAMHGKDKKEILNSKA